MSAWPNKYVIGLTGNIATGKSVVRKMLEHLGAYGIDADALGHRAMMKGAPGYQAVIDTFGKWILDDDGQVDRSKLGSLVFADPDAMEALESILHPFVLQAIDLLVDRVKQDVIVIEAIKLLEVELNTYCDAVWVADAPPKVRVERLVQRRGMSLNKARQRVEAQTPQEEKLQAADVVIRNEGSFEETWKQVLAVWKKTFVREEAEPTPEKREPVAAGEMVAQRAGPGEAAEIAAFITRVSDGKRAMTSADVMAAFGEKAFLLLKDSGKLVGILGWQVENLVTRVDDVFIAEGVDLARGVETMIKEVESASQELQCEAALIFLSPELAQQVDVWQQLGYEARTVKDLSVRAWQEAAMESMPAGTVLYFKQLRKDRVLRPV
jgi:dephospho-CoA kinase